MSKFQERLDRLHKSMGMSALPNMKRGGGRPAGSTWKDGLICDNSGLISLGSNDNLQWMQRILSELILVFMGVTK